MNCAIIGFGSIGERHFKILKKSNFFENIYLISSRIKKKNFFNSIKDLLDKKIDYFVVCNETHKHFETLNFIEKNFFNKLVMVEKPLFHQNKFIHNNINNIYYVGYNLRFNPIVTFAKKFFSNKKVFYLDMYCKTFLPNWRIGRNYRTIYSSNKNKGGGVLNDLSHELDLMNYLFGKYTINSSYSNRISNLDVSSDDICVFFGKFKKQIFFNVNLNFFSRIESRKFLIASNDITAEFDLINNQIFISKKNKLKKIKFKIDRNQEYLQMHKNILFHKGHNACHLKDAQFILKIIDKIKNK